MSEEVPVDIAASPAVDHATSGVKKQSKASKAPKVAAAAKSVDSAVQHTNDDSVVSKRSAGKVGYVSDDYLRHFVKKLSRRSPLINRGYYLRIVAMTSLIERSLRKFLSTGAPAAQVLSLGAGFDTLAARLYNEPEFQSVSFFDVDFPDVIKNKTQLMALAGVEQSFPFRNPRIVNDGKELVADRYVAAGLDLRQTETHLVPLLASLCPGRFSTNSPTIVYAECVMQYMSPECSTQIFSWIAKSFPQAVVFAYDQIHPIDSFGTMMSQSLKSKCSPLLGITSFPDGLALTRRATECGLQSVRFANFYDISRDVLIGAERSRVEALEVFDELEEWSEMCEHYGILGASTLPPDADPLADCPVMKSLVEADECRSESAPQFECKVESWPIGRCAIEGWGFGSIGSEFVERDQDTVLITFGGHLTSKGHARTGEVLLHSMRYGDIPVVAAGASSVPPPCVFHSFTRVAPWKYVVFGGRTNPGVAFDDAYLLSIDSSSFPDEMHVQWNKLTTSEGTRAAPARYRHSATCLSSSTNEATILIHGGKDARGAFLDDLVLCIVSMGLHANSCQFETLASVGSPLPPLCSSCMTCIDQSTVLLSGGLTSFDTASNHIIVIRIDVARREYAATVAPVTIGTPRFSHDAIVAPFNGGIPHLIVQGGSPVSPKPTDDLKSLMIIPVSDVLAAQPSNSRLTVGSIPKGSGADITWSRHKMVPLLPVGNQDVRSIVLVGGGFTCFSFGTYSATPVILHLSDDLAVDEQLPCMLPEPPSSGTFAHPGFHRPVEEQPFTPEGFLAAARSMDRPIVFRHAPLGDCLEKWQDPLKHLTAAEGDHSIAIHVGKGKGHCLDFVTKNFSFRHVTLREMVQHCFPLEGPAAIPPEVWYYRSVGSNMKTERSDFWKELPHLAADFSLPSGGREFIMPHVHQSCFRINQHGMQLWTHYDTMDNFLCQIVGRKRVVLFPPSQYGNLYMKGSSSRVVNIEAPDFHRFPRFYEALKHSTSVELRAGDMLMIPPNWFHHITALTSCIGINIFYERPGMDKSLYDPKDLYGNKDLPLCVAAKEALKEEVKRALTQLTTRDGVPRDYALFSLRQLIQELEEVASTMEGGN